MKEKNEKGITLIALVVTIVVLLILAGITINLLFSNGGIFDIANQAKIEHEIGALKDRINNVIADWSIGRAVDPTVTVDDLWDKMVDADIIDNPDEDVAGPEKDGENDRYELTTNEGYIVEIIISPDGNVSIGDVVKGDKLPPKIGEITATIQSNSIHIEVEITRSEGEVSLSYYYKKDGEPDSSYQTLKEGVKELTADFTGLEQDVVYNVKVIVKDENGTAEKIINERTGELKEGTVTQKGETVWSNGTATIELETTETGVTIQYQIDGIEGQWLDYKGPITGLNHGQTVYALITDGTNQSGHTSIDILDEIAPTVTVTQESKNTNSIQVSVSSSDAEWGMPDSVTYNYYIKQTSVGSYPTDPTHTGTETSYTFTGLIQNTSYDVKVTTSDKAGNPGEGQATNITTDTVGGAGDDLKEGNIIASEPTWSNGSASITLSKGTEVASNFTIQYQVGDVAEGKWTTAQEGAASVTVTGLTHNSIVYARLTDGTNYGSHASVTILDKISPQSAKIELSGQSTTTTGSITATVTHADNESGVELTKCKWIYSTNQNPIGTEETSYTNTFSDSQPIILSVTTPGTYYLHVLTIDVAGNKKETISNAVTVEKKIISDGSFNKEKGVNTPDLADGKLTPVKWVNNEMVTTTADDPDWYSYGTTADTRKWANAITEDGSIWVWIPRYAYQISSLYHSSNSSGGTINIKFMKGTSNEAADGTTTWQNASGQGNWNIHPGFNYSSTAPGIWVAKFEASRNNATAGSEGSGNTIKIQPGVQSWRTINVNDIYTTCLNYDTTTLGDGNLNSHMMKNSEWGAVAYLAQSSYGKNAEVWINPNSSFLTGQAGTGPSVSSTTSTSPYNSGNGPQASTTGNVYGVYDMSGGSNEYVAAYVANNNENLTNYGSSLVDGANYTKDIYNSSGDTQLGNYNAAASKYGDTMFETSSLFRGSNSWYSDNSNFPYSVTPFFTRGANYGNTSGTGLFSFLSSVGNASSNYGFRPVLVTF